jgi:SSS family solute:Na+ symporter
MRMNLGPLDFGIIIAYFVAVLGVGYWLKGKMKSSSDFLLSHRNFSHWITGIAFMSANLGALEVMGHTANGAKYGMRTNHWYWIGAIPAMMLLGTFMVRYYYTNGVRSVPEYLRMRYDHRAHIMSAFSFAIVTILMSGIDMFAFAKVFEVMLGWPFAFSVLLAGGVVLVFVFWGGLASSIYNEFIQFFLIVLGFLPLTFLGLQAVGGWSGLMAKIPEGYKHTWQGMATASDPLGAPAWVVIVGLGLCAAPAYWCTDFLLVQRALAARDLPSAQKTPLVAAVPKMLFPGLVTVQGMIALAMFPEIVKKEYNLALPTLMGHFYSTGMLGLGLTALLASFMSGMAGNITAFNTVFTYDIYQTYFVKGREDRHYLRTGRTATIVGTALACTSSFIVLYFDNLMDYMQLIGILFISPFFMIFFLGMYWKRPSATAGFCGMVAGISAALLQYILYRVGVLEYTSPMASNVFMAVWGFVAGTVTLVIVSFLTPPHSEATLKGLVYDPGAVAAKQVRVAWYQTPTFYAAVVGAMFLILNIVFY